MLIPEYITPVMLTDSTGCAPEWHHWMRSGLAVAVGFALVATGVFVPLGGMLIGMGVNSMVSGYLNEVNGGSFDSGYYSGALTGAIMGLTAGVGGSLWLSATEKTGLVALGYFSGAISTSAVGGFIGGFSVSALNDNLNGNQIDWEKARQQGYLSASMNIFGAYGSAVSGVFAQSGYRVLGGLIAFSAESIIDGIAYGINRITSYYDRNVSNGYNNIDFAY